MNPESPFAERDPLSTNRPPAERETPPAEPYGVILDPQGALTHYVLSPRQLAEEKAHAYDEGVRDMSKALQGGSEPVNPYREA